MHAVSSVEPSASGAVSALHLHALPARRRQTVVLASGNADAGQRATLAFTAALAAQSMDLDTMLFFVGEGAYWAYEGRAEEVNTPGFPPLACLIESFLEVGGQLVLCSACESVCGRPTGGGGAILRPLPGLRVQGMASVLAHSSKGSALTF